ncbi:dolichyl-diphosphooligosaccharide--protein glycosyltransferase subunit 1 [Tribolium castaneum]|nr:PREDICTED: dolichyl-diphosphooligosaccharide--protein glycosyltransferase subunit 1-like [Tribolium castaneum]|eukprot:XP_008198423.1 PREDICTED: dolichyl-diphosphooligosaccharide--protein glycosyltransferase subunit 1-like [Tribolium castaneum]
MSPFFLAFFAFISPISSQIVNLDVRSSVELHNQLVHELNEVVFVNRGPPTQSYTYAIEGGSHSVYFTDERGKSLDFESTIKGLRIKLDETVLTGEKFKLFAKIIHANAILPMTRTRKFDQDQVVKYDANVRFFSLYGTENFTRRYNLLNNSLLEYTVEPNLVANDHLVYSFTSLGPRERAPLVLVFVNNDPFLIVRSLERTIDVNHFGKITIEDRVTLENNGAALTGPYHFVPQIRGKASTGWLYTHLPASAENVEFFDDLGNCSETRVYNYGTYKTLKFKTRYPLLGGWKTTYNLRYDVPTYEYLFVLGDFFKLQMRAVDYVINDKVVENAVVRVFLPEGSRVDNVALPPQIGLMGEELGCLGSLCVYGRPIVVLNGTDLFDNYVQNLEIEYFLRPLFLLKAPILITAYLEVGFVAVLGALRYFTHL